MTLDIVHNASRSVIEAFVREKLEKLKEDPERNTRNLIDTALHFSKGRFQRYFFELAQGMMQNEQSGYYKFLRDVIVHIDSRHLLTFGMNIGYNSCFAGAKTIRRLEDAHGFNIPWAVTLQIDGASFDQAADAYRSLFDQGQELGIYTWMLFVKAQPEELFPLISAEPDCAFIVFTCPEALTDAVLDSADKLGNLMLTVEYTENAYTVCNQMRKKKMPYSVYIPYGTDILKDLNNGNLMCDISELYPVFAFFVAQNIPDNISDAVYRYVLAVRNQPEYRSVPFEFKNDLRKIDSIVSDDDCEVAFDTDGNLMLDSHMRASLERADFHGNANFRELPLFDILQASQRKDI